MKINPFWSILLIALLICAFGVSAIYSSTYQKEGKMWQDIYKRQIIWICIGVILYLLASKLNYRLYWDLSWIFYALGVLLLLVVVGLGIVRLGAQRWIRLAWFNFQPSELAKLTLTIFLARYFSKKGEQDLGLPTGRFGIWKGLLKPLFFVGIPMALIVDQPDLGSGLMLLFLFIAMLYVTDVKLRYILLLLAVLIIPIPFLWHLLREYQKQRLLVFLNPNIDPLGAGYTVIQSRIAIGSGGFFGKGWLSGTQSQLRFLPESHTDFIFATFAEEWGFLGCCILLFLYFQLIRYGFSIAQHTQDSFGKLLAFGISFMLSIQVFINLSMNMGHAPVVGLPLPLMSYGGSSVAITFLALGILVNIDRRRQVF